MYSTRQKYKKSYNVSFLTVRNLINEMMEKNFFEGKFLLSIDELDSCRSSKEMMVYALLSIKEEVIEQAGPKAIL